MGLLLEVVPDADADAIRRWHMSRRVDGVLLTDLIPDDPRISVVSESAIPAVVVGDPSVAARLTTVWTNDAQAMHPRRSSLCSSSGSTFSASRRTIRRLHGWTA